MVTELHIQVYSMVTNLLWWSAFGIYIHMHCIAFHLLCWMGMEYFYSFFFLFFHSIFRSDYSLICVKSALNKSAFLMDPLVSPFDDSQFQSLDSRYEPYTMWTWGNKIHQSENKIFTTSILVFFLLLVVGDVFVGICQWLAFDDLKLEPFY